MQLLKLSLTLAAAHLLLVVVVFLVFGLGLEGATVGGALLTVLLQPLHAILGLVDLDAGRQNVLLPINSLIWGLALALLARWRRFSRPSPPENRRS